jgi:hypothetical protein
MSDNEPMAAFEFIPFAHFSHEDREFAKLILERAEANGVTDAGDQADLIERIFGQRP